MPVILKICFKCRQEKPIEDFYKHPAMADGHLGKCKECSKAYAKVHYSDNREYYVAYNLKRTKDPERRAKWLQYQRNQRKRSPQKTKARDAVYKAIKSGKLLRMPCSCGNPESEAHHNDYSKPLEVEWLCFRCHRERHGQTVS